MVGLGALLAAGTATLAGEITVTPSVTTSIGYSDNIDQEPDGLKTDAFIYELTPGVQVRAEGGRFEGGLDALTQFSYTSDGDDEGTDLRPVASLQTTTELSRNLLFFDANGSISQQLLDAQQANTEANRDTTFAYELSPYLVNRFGTFAESELRYGFGQVHVDSDDFSTDTTNAGRLNIESGNDFGRLRWGTTGLISHTDRSDDNNIERRLVDQEFEYALNRHFSLIGAGGYEYFDDGDSQNQIDGPTWRAGFRLRGARGELLATYGQRDGDEVFGGNLNYEVGAFTTVRAGYTDTVETDQQRLLAGTAGIAVDPDTGVLIDTSTGLPFDPAASNSSFSNEVTRNRTFTAGVTFNKGQNIVDLNGRYEDQEDQSGPDDETHKFIELSWQRRLNRRTNLQVFGSYERSEFQDDDTNDDEYIAGALLSYSIRDNVQVFATYTYRHQDSTDPTNEFEENRATVGLQYTFDTFARGGAGP